MLSEIPRILLPGPIGGKMVYAHLLRPRAGGIAFVLSAMREQIHNILDVTIVYPEGVSSFWALLCGKIRKIKVRVRSLPVTPEMLGDYAADGQFRLALQSRSS